MEVDTKNTENTVISNRKLNKTILDNFSNLIKPQEKIRIKSSLTLLKYLSENDAEKVSFSFSSYRNVFNFFNFR